MKYAVFILMLFALGCVSLSLALDNLRAHDFQISANVASFTGPETAPPEPKRAERILPAATEPREVQPGSFQGPQGEPYIIGPSADPPNY